MDNSSIVCATVHPTFFNATPSYGSNSFSGMGRVGIAILVVQHFCQSRLGIIVHSTGKASMQSFIPELSFLEAKTTLFFGCSNSLPIKKMDFFLISSGSPNRVSLDLVDGGSDFLEKIYILHDMRGNTVEWIQQGRFDQPC